MAEKRGNQRPHVWRFFRAGGFDQVRIDTGADAAAFGTLDQKLWVALACPTRGIEFDERTLDLIDAGMDGRNRAPEALLPLGAATPSASALLASLAAYEAMATAARATRSPKPIGKR